MFRHRKCRTGGSDAEGCGIFSAACVNPPDTKQKPANLCPRKGLALKEGIPYDTLNSVETAKFLGHPITRSSQISLADQLHDILCEEIHAGRWRIGEKLPSMMAIAKECGASRMPVQQAIDRLGEEGYVRQQNRSGVYLASKLPEGREPLGTIGIVLMSETKTEREMEHLAYEQLLVHRFIKAASDRNYQTRVHYAESGQNWQELNRAGAVFGGNVKGIVSLVPFSRSSVGHLAENEIPLVFWCVPDHRCAPCVASDYDMAFYLLTKELIACGHREIIPLACSTITLTVVATYLSGYRKAMAEANLPCREDCFEESRGIAVRDIAGLGKLLGRQSEATAVACMSRDRAEQTVSTLALMGKQVPDGISVVGTNPAAGPMPNGLKLSGVGFSPEKEIDMCFDLLRSQALKRQWDVATVRMMPFIVEGGTVSPPPTPSRRKNR